LHDADEGRRLPVAHLLIANRVLAPLFLRHIDNRKPLVIHLPLEPPRQNAIHIFDHAMIFLRTGDQIEVRHVVEQLRAARLRHAPEKPIDNVRLRPPVPADLPHLTERLLLRLVTHRARVDQNDIRLVLARRQRIARAFEEHARDLVRVALIHLAAISPNVNVEHELPHSRRSTPAGNIESPLPSEREFCVATVSNRRSPTEVGNFRHKLDTLFAQDGLPFVMPLTPRDPLMAARSLSHDRRGVKHWSK
jgi:hypothetical protein